MRSAALLAVLLAACSGGAETIADATIIDGATGDGQLIDAPAVVDAPVDAPGGGTVACGTMTCGGTTECCVSGASQSCVPVGTCSGAVLACDGREDCGANQDCCVMLGLPFGPFGTDGGLPGFDGGLPGFDGGLPGFDGGLPGFDGGLPGLDGGLPGLDGGTSGGGATCAPAGSCQVRACNDPTDCNSGERCCPGFGGVMACSQFCT